jgi:hypothetical protein
MKLRLTDIQFWFYFDNYVDLAVVVFIRN